MNRVNNFINMRNTFCLNSVTSYNQIHSSPVNRSSSKNLWSFAKDSRFKKPKVYCDNIYNSKSSLTKDGKGIGYGKKSDFTKDLTCSPGSSKYKLDTIFDRNRKSRRGFSVGLSREKIPSRGYIPLEPLKNPGPNRYNNMKLYPDSSYSMRMKTKTIDRTMSIQAQNDNPGAGRYENPEAMSPRGNYTVSKHKGTGATSFSPRRSVRFFEFKKQVPGPGAYQEIDGLSNSGRYQLSRSTGFGKRMFDKERRVVEFESKAKKNLIPGPGSYRAPSEFGQYDGEVYNMNITMYGSSFTPKDSTSRIERKNSVLRSSRRR